MQSRDAEGTVRCRRSGITNNDLPMMIAIFLGVSVLGVLCYCCFCCKKYEGKRTGIKIVRKKTKKKKVDSATIRAKTQSKKGKNDGDGYFYMTNNDYR